MQTERSTKRLWVLGAHLRPFVRAVRARGFDPEQALLRVGLTLATLEDPYERIPRGRFLQFLSACQDLTADADRGLHAGELARVEDFDISGLLMRSSPSVSAFYDQLDRRDEASERRPDIMLQAGAVTFRQGPQAAVPTPRIVGEYFTGMVMTGFTLMTGPVEPIEVRFLHPRPHDTREHERIFRAPLRFDAGENALVLPAEVMSRPMKDADAALAHVLRRHIERMRETFAATPDDLPERVRHLLSEELPGGRVTIGHIAARLHQSGHERLRVPAQHAFRGHRRVSYHRAGAFTSSRGLGWQCSEVRPDGQWRASGCCDSMAESEPRADTEKG